LGGKGSKWKDRGQEEGKIEKQIKEQIAHYLASTGGGGKDEMKEGDKGKQKSRHIHKGVH